jgi:Protein of unknown function (DUF2924)
LEDIHQRIKELPGLQRSQLLDLWRSNFSKTAPAGIRRELMIPILAYRIQERAYGGLTKEIILKLRKIAQELSRNPTALGRSLRIKTGTRMVRQWKGQIHEVTVVNDGFLYRGTNYKSLSEIARQITGTRWSGPLFFGLKRRIAKNGEQQ